MLPEFTTVFNRLRAMLEQHSRPGAVPHEKPGYYWLELPATKKLKKPFWIGGVQAGKNYVSFHLMPVYMCPSLLDGVSAKLKARKQGKACFNFKSVDESLFAELDTLTARGFDAVTKAGYIPSRPDAS